jgi:glycosyltransferase involved in cell wall biosynthesis
VFILKEVWPIISRYNVFRLEIIGASVHPKIRRLASHFADVSVVGYVPSIEERLSSALASLCLVELDVGVQTKLLESMACGTPAVCGRASAEGIGATADQHLVVADSPQSVADALKRLRDSAEYWERLSMQGREFVRSHHQWSESAVDLLRILSR